MLANGLRRESGTELGAEALSSIAIGEVYIYFQGFPVNCHGSRYRAHRFVTDVPTYQQKVLVEALDGPDAGMWFTCSLSNFSRRYRRESA